MLKGTHAIISAKWWAAAGIRAIKSAAQMAVIAIGGAVVISDVEWYHVLGAAGLAAILSLITSLAGLPELEVEHVTDTERLDNDQL